MDIFWGRDLTKVQLRGLEFEESALSKHGMKFTLNNNLQHYKWSMQERCKPFAIPPFTAFFKLEGREGCYCGAEGKTMKQLYI